MGEHTNNLQIKMIYRNHHESIFKELGGKLNPVYMIYALFPIKAFCYHILILADY